MKIIEGILFAVGDVITLEELASAADTSVAETKLAVEELKSRYDQQELSLIHILKLGSFTGNGISDVFCATGSNWQYSYNGRNSWTSLMNTTVPYNTVNLADFTGSGKTDVICLVNGLWHISVDGNTAVKRNLTTNFPLANFVYGSLQ